MSLRSGRDLSSYLRIVQGVGFVALRSFLGSEWSRCRSTLWCAAKGRGRAPGRSECSSRVQHSYEQGREEWDSPIDDHEGGLVLEEGASRARSHLGDAVDGIGDQQQCRNFSGFMVSTESPM